jgi:predicted Rossmann fold flavoprotein
LNEVNKYKIEVLKNNPVKNISKNESYWEISTKNETFSCNTILVATGSNSKIWDILHGLGHTIVKPVPSLFTFNINDERIKNIPGVVLENVTIKVLDSYLTSFGPLLITHWGLSAPAILKLSAFGALEFANREYKFKIAINFVNIPQDEVLHELRNYKQSLAKKTLFNSPRFELPKRLWNELVKASGIIHDTRWADLNKNQLEDLSSQLTEATFQVDGKSTFKEEFVTAGGIDLKEINFKTFESKLHKDLYFAGEILNIDAVTGGFNFQNAWTGAFIAADAIALN